MAPQAEKLHLPHQPWRVDRRRRSNGLNHFQFRGVQWIRVLFYGYNRGQSVALILHSYTMYVLKSSMFGFVIVNRGNEAEVCLLVLDRFPLISL